MDMNKLWKSSEEIEEERIEQEIEARKQDIKKAREDNLIQDTEVLADMVVMSMMENLALAEELEKLKEDLEVLKNGNGK